jgi:hypothetical protein
MKIISLGGVENNMLGCLHETENISGRSTGRGLRVCVDGLRQQFVQSSRIHQRPDTSSDQRAGSLRRQVVGRVGRQIKIKPGGGFARSVRVQTSCAREFSELAWILSGVKYNCPMKIPLFAFAVAGLLLAGCGKSDSGTPASGPANDSMDAAGAMARSQAKAVATVDLTSLDKAIQMFNVNEGRFPKDLNELLQSKLIGKIPDAPQGKKINYDPATGKVSLVPQ